MGSPARHRQAGPMPTVLWSGPYRFFFYAGDCDEPAHVHVRHGNSEAKFWLDPVGLARNRGFNPHELGRIQRIVRIRSHELKRAWDEYHGPEAG